jgi:hypothetical protein
MSTNTTGQRGFYGVVFLVVNLEGPDWEWRAYPVDADRVDIVDGAAVFSLNDGTVLMAFAPGRWKEISWRPEIDREVFQYKPVPPEVAEKLQDTARKRDGHATEFAD